MRFASIPRFLHSSRKRSVGWRVNQRSGKPPRLP